MVNKKKLTVAEILRSMRNPDFDPKTYFVVDEARSRAFAPCVTYNLELVDLGASDVERARSEAALPFLNDVERARRRAAFELKILEGYSGPVLVSEGDSWFQYPFLLLDVIDYLIQDYAISSLDAAGDTLEQMIRQDEYLEEIRKWNASILLFSGGGNDALGGGDLKLHLRPYDPSLKPAQHIRSSFSTLIDHAMGEFDKIYRRVANEAPGTHIITHSYDYVVPDKQKWLGEPMEALGIADKTFQKAISDELIDRFALAMAKLASRYPHVHFLDNRGKVPQTEWHDELHPTDAGFKTLATQFKVKIEEVSQTARGLNVTRTIGSRGLSSRAQPLQKGLSLHLGLNKIDPAYYGSECPLFGCHNDAEDMATIVRERGYNVMGTLLDGNANVKALRNHVQQAATTLKAGDIFLLTYSGHGSQIPDFNGDENDPTEWGGGVLAQDGQNDGMDETWCLFDRELIDDELFELWTLFEEGVRIVVVSDSCHSGTVIRTLQEGLIVTDPSTPEAMPGRFRSRLLPMTARRNVILNHRNQYETIAREVDARLGGPQRMRNARLLCTVRLFSGCLDHQTSADGDLNGLFTQQMLFVLSKGFTGSYEQFSRAVRLRMPADQTPNHWVIGRKDPAFDSQRPFEI